jgi:endoglucanase
MGYTDFSSGCCPPKAASAGANGIYLNQIGFLPDSPKVATVSARANSFLVRSLKGNSVAFRSTLSAQRLDDASGDTVRFADFSSVKTPGEYRLELDTGVRGNSFAIRKDAYDNALLLTMRSFYGQRCGIEVNLGGGYAHPRCHLEAAFHHPSSGKTDPCNIRGAGTMRKTTGDT